MKTFRFVCSALVLMVLMPSAQAQDTCRTGYLAPDVEIGALTLDLRDSGETNLRVAAVHRDGAIRSHFDRFTDAEKDWDSESMIDFVRNNHKECEQSLNPTPEPEPEPTPSAEQTYEAPVREYRQEAQCGRVLAFGYL